MSINSTLSPVLDTPWFADLQASIDKAPLTPRSELLYRGHLLGSVDAQAFAAFADRPELANVVQRRGCLTSAKVAWEILGDPVAAMNKIATLMRQTGYAQVAHLWRDEQLAVCSANGHPVASVERGAVRALGIATHGVHLHGYTTDGLVWIQQRALDKKTDPGGWDTLMGGMVSAADTLASALARETFEETGLRLDQLLNLRTVGHFTLRMPNSTVSGLEYVVERIDWFQALLPPGVLPINQDGEVQQFRLANPAELRAMLLQNAFTTQASLILAQS